MSSRRFAAFLAGCILASHVASAQPTLLSAVLRPAGGGTTQSPSDAIDRFLSDYHVTSPRASASGGFGEAVALEGSRLVVGATYEDAPRAVYVFEFNGAVWSLAATVSPRARDDHPTFGVAVALSGDTIAIGHPYSPYEEGTGHVDVYVRTGATWALQARLDVGANVALDRRTFGAVIALDGDTLVVGATDWVAKGHGRAVVYERDGDAWRFAAELAPTPDEDTSGYETFGKALAALGDTILVGMPGGDRVLRYAKQGGTWSHGGTWRGDSGSAFGTSVDLDGTTAVVGAPGLAGPGDIGAPPGKVHVFAGTSDTWFEQARLASAAPLPDDRFGQEVALSGDVLAISSPESSPDRETKLVALFVRQETTWTLREELRGDAARASGTYFPGAIALSGQTIAVGTFDRMGYAADEVLVSERNLLDEDADGLPDGWETRFGLVVGKDDAANAAGGDPDGDGITNVAELAAGTHPTGLPSATRYLAEGATGPMFDAWIAIANPGSQVATVLLRFLGPDDWTRAVVLDVPPLSIRRVHVNDIPGLGDAEAFSTVIESNVPVVVEREMAWDRTWWYGAHADAAVDSPATTWYFAEGATHSGFDLFYLLQNPGDVTANVKVTYLRPFPLPPLERTYVVAPRSRCNVWVNTEPGLDSTDVSAIVESTNGAPIIAERAMYASVPGRLFAAGHVAAGAAAPALEWSLAEGATGTYFDLFVLIANPGPREAEVEARFLFPDGHVVTREYRVAPRSRFNIWVDHEGPELADTAVSTTVRSTPGAPIVVERAMWWPGPTASTWAEAHAVRATTASATKWAFAAGSLGAVVTGGAPIIVRAMSDPWWPPVELDMTLAFSDGGFLQKRVTMPTGGAVAIDPVAEIPEAAGRAFVVRFQSRGRTLCAPHSCFQLWAVRIEVVGGRRLDSVGLEWVVEGPAADTYVLVANLGNDTAQVRATLLYETGAGPSRTYQVRAQSRFNIDMRAEFPEAVGRAFGMVVESLGQDPPPLVVERAAYSRALGQPWSAGSAAMGTRWP